MTYDTTPKPALLRAMQNQSWTIAGAISELVDNSFGAGRGDARRVEITYDRAHRILTVLDNGRGMDGVGQLFRLGDGIGRQPKDIGEYGSGGTMAILWLNRSVEVWTLRAGKVNHAHVDWPYAFRQPDFPQVSDSWSEATATNTPAELLNVEHGTLIRCTLLAARDGFHISNVKRDLAQTYAPATRSGRELAWRTIQANGDFMQQYLADPITLLNADKRVDFDLSVVLKDGAEPLHATGQVGIVDDLPASRSVVHVGFGSRVILRTRDCYRSPDGLAQYSGVGITGYLDLGDGWQPYLSTTKDQVHHRPLWAKLMGHIFTRIEPLLKERDVEKMSVVLEGIALNLETALNSEFTVTVDVVGGEGEDREPGDEHGTHSHAATPKSPEKPQSKDEKSVTRIYLEPRSDADLEHLLCRVVVEGDGMIVQVNGDHPYIQEAMKAQPINRMALNGVITGEMARVIVENKVLMNRVFKRRVRQAIEENPDPAAYAHRLLLDMCRTGLGSEEAIAS